MVQILGLFFSEPVRGCFNCNRSVFEPVVEHVAQVLDSVARSLGDRLGGKTGGVGDM